MYCDQRVTVHKSADTIQGRKLFKGGNYSRKYGIYYRQVKMMMNNFASWNSLALAKWFIWLLILEQTTLHLHNFKAFILIHEPAAICDSLKGNMCLLLDKDSFEPW